MTFDFPWDRYRYYVIAAGIVLGLMSVIAHTASTETPDGTLKGTNIEADQRIIDGLRRGKIEGAFLFNHSLNPMALEITVTGNRAKLEGTVETHVQRDLAREIALSIDGIDRVTNQIQVDPETATQLTEAPSEVTRSLSDNAITARIKTKLLANINVPGAQIHVYTEKGEVTLSGNVSSIDEQQLAYYLTRNTEGILAVHNDITVDTALND